MGLGFALFFHIILYGILLLALWPVFWLVQKLLRLTDPSAKRVLRLARFGVAGLPFAAFVAAIVWSNIAPPSFLYWNVFDRWADTTVRNMRGSTEGTNDGQEVFLAFDASDGTLSNILSTDPFIAVENPVWRDLLPMPSGDPVPAWWTAPKCADRTTYVASYVRQWDHIVVTSCRDDARIYVQARWID